MKTLLTLLVVSFAITAHGQALPDAPSVACARSVMCDDAIPNMEGHKWGDVLPKCFDPTFKGPVEFATVGACEAQAVSPAPIVAVVKTGFWRGHPTRSKIIIAAIGGGAGLAIALATRDICPSKINGYPYSGTPTDGHCPNPATYDPGGKSVRLRWRF